MTSTKESTALLSPCMQDIILSLLFNGADPSLKDNQGGTALLAACQAGHVEVIDILKRHGAKLGMESMTEVTGGG